MKKRGLTLVELLAAIVVLAILAIIVIPITNNMIEISRKQAFELVCEEIYSSEEIYSIESNSNCSIFDFSSDRKESTIIDNIVYEPISKLVLKGEMPKHGTFKICDDKILLIIDNNKYTCIRSEEVKKILNGTIEENDTTAPILNDIALTSNPNSIKVIVDAKEPDGKVVKYYYKINDGEFIEYNSNVYIFTNLKQETNYEISVFVENEVGLKSDIISKTISTKLLSNPTFTVASKVPETGYTWASKKVIDIIYSDGNVVTSNNYFKSTVSATVGEETIISVCGTDTVPGTCTTSSVTTLAANTWYKTTEDEVLITYTDNGKLYAITSDGLNKTETSTYTISKMDSTKPTIEIEVSDVRSDRATVTATCSATSGITKYEFNVGAGWLTSESNTYTFTGLKSGTNYTYSARCTSGSGLTNTKSSGEDTKGLVNPTIKEVSKVQASGYTWAKSRVIGVTYSDTDIETPNYYFKSSVAATVSSGVVTASCGTSTVPGTCTTSSVTTLAANTWYKTNSSEVSATYTKNGKLYAITSDGTNKTETSTYTISKTDSAKPTIPTITGGGTSWSKTSKTISVATESTAASGILRYQYYASTSSTSLAGGSWTNIETGSTSFDVSTNGTRYIFVRAISNSGIGSSSSQPQTTMIDTVSPTVTASLNGKVATLTLSDNIGVTGYNVTTSNTAPTTWTEIDSVAETTKEWTATSAGTYYAWVKDASGRTASTSFEISSSLFSYPATGTTYCKCSCNNGLQGWGHCHNYHEVQLGQSVTWVTVYSCPNGGTLSGNVCIK